LVVDEGTIWSCCLDPAGPMSKASLSKRENWPSNVYTIIHGKPRLSKRGEGKSAQQVHPAPLRDGVKKEG
ncbi:MAG: hypothetical protein ACYS19_20065, partial [Planctomycetota bacterium]